MQNHNAYKTVLDPYVASASAHHNGKHAERRGKTGHWGDLESVA